MSSNITENGDGDGSEEAEASRRVLLAVSLVAAAVICAGGSYSLASLLRTRMKSCISLMVASLAVDDLISLVPLALSVVLQWRRDDAVCTVSGLLYVFQGLSSNMKSCLIVAYTFYVTRGFGVRRRGGGGGGGGSGNGNGSSGGGIGTRTGTGGSQGTLLSLDQQSFGVHQTSTRTSASGSGTTGRVVPGTKTGGSRGTLLSMDQQRFSVCEVTGYRSDADTGSTARTGGLRGTLLALAQQRFGLHQSSGDDSTTGRVGGTGTRTGAGARTGGPRGTLLALALVWTVSLAVSVLPLCGWGRFAPASVGCLPESDGFYVLLLFTLYSLCFCGLVACSVPLTYPLLCSAQNLDAFYPYRDPYFVASVSRDSLAEKSFGKYCSEFGLGRKSSRVERSSCSSLSPKHQHFGECGRDVEDGGARAVVVFAQKRFSVILAMTRIVLWMPMMAQILVSHAVQIHSPSLETLCFFLTLLSATVTPVFVLSERWIHLPCGCFINCRRGPGSSTAQKRRFEFKLSFQQGYSIYRISHATSPSSCYNSLYNCHFSESRVAVLDTREFGTDPAAAAAAVARDVSQESQGGDQEEAKEEEAEKMKKKGGAGRGIAGPTPSSTGAGVKERDELNLDSSSVFDGPERRLSHEECRKIELTDWEWCRSKSERTPRQRSSGGLAIPLCAFQGTVSLHAPTGKTLSLSTYEVSSDGLRISPNNAKKVEVYRSKSVGHEPSAEEPNSTGGSGTSGVPVPSGVADTNVKIHLEVLEICDNEEAMDSVSIVSNISQSSTHARSPSLRYSRRENRFVSCDLGESASYSLLIPGTNPDADSINITIPDTVEAHRQNSRKQRQEAGGYREEIQLLNEVYRKQTGDQGD